MTDETKQPETPKKPKKEKAKSRAARWAGAVGNAKDALSTISGACAELDSAIAELEGIRQEYEDWKDNLPENLSSSPLGEKLEEVVNLDIASLAENVQSAVTEAENTLDEAENIELPQGFGRD